MTSAYFQDDVVASRRILYTPSSFAKDNLTFLQEIGELVAQKPHMSKRTNLISYLFFIVQDGQGTLTYEGQEYALSAGDCVFIDCKNGYSHATGDHLWTLQWVHFFGPTLHGIHQKYMERGGCAVFRPDQRHAFEQLWTRLYQTAESADYVRDMRINELLSSLLTLLMEQSWNPDNAPRSAKKQSLHQIRAFLDENYSQRLILDDLAERFFLNKYYMVHMFKEEFGCTILEHLQKQRITHAKKLLRFTDQTTDAIAAASGLTDANYLSRVFRKYEGTSPTEYRKRWRS